MISNLKTIVYILICLSFLFLSRIYVELLHFYLSTIEKYNFIFHNIHIKHLSTEVYYL